MNWLDKKIQEQKIQNRWRELRSVPSKCIDFCSNDYLGLSHHTLLKERSIEFLKKWGCGSRASRLISGTLPCHLSLEKKLAEFKNKESSLLFNSGFQANIGVLSAIIDKETLVFVDRFCHHSILKGIELGKGRLIRFRHNDTSHLEDLLKKSQTKKYRSIIITESVFGMNGDTPDIDRLIACKKEFGSLLYIDEAHSTGIMGVDGRGLALHPAIDFVMGTCGKAMGSFGAFLACSNIWKDYLINFCGGFIFTTSLPPSIIGSIDAAIDLVPTMNQERKTLFKNSKHLKDGLHKKGWSTGDSTTHILPLCLQEETKALEIAICLQNAGIFAQAIRPPTVPPNASCIRIALTAKHKKKDIEKLLFHL